MTDKGQIEIKRGGEAMLDALNQEQSELQKAMQIEEREVYDPLKVLNLRPEIKEIVRDIQDFDVEGSLYFKCCIAENLINKGYRKEKETVKEIFEKIRNRLIEITSYGCDCTQHCGYYDYSIKVGDCIEEINDIAQEYGIEVE